MALNSILNSRCRESEQRWLDQMRRIFEKAEVDEMKKEVDACVFEVPKSTSAFKPEAYTPQLIGLGPYHHFRPELYQMQWFKIAAAKGFLKSDQILNFQHLIINQLEELELTIRACYNKYLDLDYSTLAWIDGLFLLHFLCNQDGFAGNKLKMDATTRDIMMLENQIPVNLLKRIWRTLKLSLHDDDDNELLTRFCKIHSPLALSLNPRYELDADPVHLLDLMYHLIINKRAQKPRKKAAQKRMKMAEVSTMEVMGNVGQIIDIGIPGAEVIQKPVKVIQNLPWDKICGLVGKQKLQGNNSGTTEGETPQVEEINIPSVSELFKVAKIKFSPTPRQGGIRDIEFNEKELTFYLPVITLNVNSEVILRNLVAYEALSGSTLELGGYVDLMSGIIDAAEDARLLREMGIIIGSDYLMTDEEIAQLFNRINKSTGKAHEESELEKNIYW
uniref:Uncharacterized protein n=1 Tax=Davidia involucrata TaxID=16924 RepID=A0A5B7BKT7_DAVIN